MRQVRLVKVTFLFLKPSSVGFFLDIFYYYILYLRRLISGSDMMIDLLHTDPVC
jgi:hypothetical protein